MYILISCMVQSSPIPVRYLETKTRYDEHVSRPNKEELNSYHLDKRKKEPT